MLGHPSVRPYLSICMYIYICLHWCKCGCPWMFFLYTYTHIGDFDFCFGHNIITIFDKLNYGCILWGSNIMSWQREHLVVKSWSEFISQKEKDMLFTFIGTKATNNAMSSWEWSIINPIFFSYRRHINQAFCLPASFRNQV